MHDAGRGVRGVEEPELPPNLFVISLLHDLQVGNYSRRAWGVFVRDSWRRSWQTMMENPGLRRSWLRFTTAGTVGILVAGGVCAWLVAPSETVLFLATSLLWWAVLMADLGLHLGLMVNLESGELRRTIGVPNMLTELRAFGSIWVAWGAHWLTEGMPIPLVFVFGVAAVTDLLDGWIARRAHVSTRWGRLYDPFMDGIFFGVAAISLAVIGVLPPSSLCGGGHRGSGTRPGGGRPRPASPPPSFSPGPRPGSACPLTGWAPSSTPSWWWPRWGRCSTS